MSHVIIALGVILSLAACGKSPASSSNASISSQSEGPMEGWKTYEDDWIRVQYPEASDIGGAENGKQDQNFPTFAAVPPSKDGVSGAFTLQLDTKTKGMLLRDAIQSEVANHVKPRGAVLSGPRDIKVGNGKCLSALVTAPSERCAAGEGSCHTPYLLTLCDGPEGRRYTATTLLSTTRDPNVLTPEGQQQAAVYERILRSLEFKKS